MFQRWQCPHCGTLLGLRHGNQIEIRYKTARYVVKAADSIEATCRKCGKRVKTT